MNLSERFIDLHMHSKYSDDGEFTPIQLVDLCRQAGIKIMSITDHNCVKANTEAAKEAAKSGIEYISGIEIDCSFQGVNLHVLGYGIAFDSIDFENTGREYRQTECFGVKRTLAINTADGL